MSETRAELPEGWEWVKLEDVCHAQSGGTPRRGISEYYGGDILWAKIEDLTRAGKWISTTDETITEQALKETNARVFPANTVLFAMYGSIGTTSIAAIPLSTNQAILGCQCSERILPEFLYSWFQLVKAELLARGRGGTQANVNATIIRSLEIPLPPIDEQIRLVEALQIYMAEVDKARAATEAQLEAAEKLRDAYLQDTFESEEAEEWSLVKLGSLLKTVQNGIYKKAEFYGQGHTFLRMYNIANDSWHLILDHLAEVTLEAHELKKYQLDRGDLLVSRVNSFELVGKCAYVDDEALGYVFENMMIRLQVTNEGVLNPLFLAQQFNSDFVRQQIQSVAKRAIGQSSVNSKDIKGLEIRLPTLSRQIEIANFLNELTQQMSELKRTLQDQYSFIKALPVSLLSQAFSGELTRQPSPEDLRAALTCLAVERLHYRPFFGVVMLMKVLYFAQVHHGIPLGYTMRRHTYGPFDKAVYNLEKEGERQGWFSVDKAVDKQGSRYVPGAELDSLAREAEGTLGRWKGELNGLLDLAETFDTTGLEALATLHAAWNDLLLEGRHPTDGEIIAEVLEGWPGKKDKFSKGELRQYLAYLKTSPYVPIGTGQSTKLVPS